MWGAYGGVLQDYRIRARVAVQLAFFRGTDQHASRGMHDALGHACSAAGVHDQERVLERHPFEVYSGVSISCLHKVLQSDRSWHALQTRRLPWETRLRDNSLKLLDPTHPFHDLLDLRAQIDGLAVVHRPVVDKDVLGLDLQQALQNALGAHVCAARAE